MKKTLIIQFIAALLTGCAVYTPAGSVVVDPHRQVAPVAPGNGRFCPPGQAKKGNC